MTKPINRVAIIGTGVIGASWASLFLAKGLHVVATDVAPNAEAAYIEYLYQSSNNVVQSAWASAVSWVSPQATCQAP